MPEYTQEEFQQLLSRKLGKAPAPAPAEVAPAGPTEIPPTSGLAGTPQQQRAFDLLFPSYAAGQRAKKRADVEHGELAAPLTQKVSKMYSIGPKEANQLILRELPKFQDEQSRILGAQFQLNQVNNIMDAYAMKGSDIGPSYYRKFAPTKLLNPQDQELSNAVSSLEAIVVPTYLIRTRLGQQATEWFRSHVPHIDDTYDTMKLKIPQLRGFLNILKTVKDPFVSEDEMKNLEEYMNAHPTVATGAGARTAPSKSMSLDDAIKQFGLE